MTAPALMMVAQLGADIELGEDALAIHGRFPLGSANRHLTLANLGWACACSRPWQRSTTSHSRSNGKARLSAALRTHCRLRWHRLGANFKATTN